VISKTEVVVAGDRIATPDAIARGDLLASARLVDAMSAPRTARRIVIVQADAETDTAAINAVSRASRVSGSSLVFAVKNR
jgi:hypothetical protein